MAGLDSLSVPGRRDVGVEDAVQFLVCSTVSRGVQDEAWPGLIIISPLDRLRCCGSSNPLDSPGVGETFPEGKGVLLPGKG